jgi:hypothetical protein
MHLGLQRENAFVYLALKTVHAVYYDGNTIYPLICKRTAFRLLIRLGFRHGQKLSYSVLRFPGLYLFLDGDMVE